ncbi:hypothetical protein ABES80_11005 [Bacillus gobiensis]|uniref:hypothetical protein n=1 Tax=Bacillus gobiensis TaxID=1441095 RepID=UPI003D24296D
MHYFFSDMIETINAQSEGIKIAKENGVFKGGKKRYHAGAKGKDLQKKMIFFTLEFSSCMHYL